MLSYIAQGFIQGLSEFLPISSSGHLTLFQYFTNSTNLEANILTNITLHFATLLAVVFYFRQDIIPYLTLSGWRDSGRRKVAFLVIIGSIPTAIIGITFKKQFEALFSNPTAVCIALSATGILLLLCERLKTRMTQHSLEGTPYWKSLIIGFIQGLAITPGISRSGSTIATSLLLGINGEDSAKFSFLLMIPAVSGATLLEIVKIYNSELPPGIDITGLIAGFITATMVGFLALKLLVYMIKKQKLSYFSYYLFAISAICLSMIHLMGK